MWFSSISFSFNIENWKSKLHNRDFQCLILKNWKSKIYNLNFQFLLLRKVKLNIILQYFENQKLKIENGQLVVLTFCFQFPLPKIQAIKNSNLNKAIHVQQTARNGVTAGWNPKYWKIVFWFSYLWKTKLPTDQKYLLWKGRVKPEVARLQTRWRSSWSEGVFSTSSPGSPRFPEDPGDEVGNVPCLRRAVSRGNVTPTAI